MDRGDDVCVQNSVAETAEEMIGKIFASARKGEIAAIEEFLGHGGDVNAYDQVSEPTDKSRTQNFIIS